ncbi:unnamed protein product, partial [Mesorhabditis belari]|uniref:G-protein coupled receptors family 1 profile domain-containing protein n=1 Tax=Mesorhabditis belari TaxID=2138241 RepID=A0AAF3EGI2_9BILA
MRDSVDFALDEYESSEIDGNGTSEEEIIAWLAMNQNGQDGSMNAHLSIDLSGWSALVNTAFGFGVSYVSLGGIAILMNGTFLFALLSKRSQVFSHVFYVMIFNFVLIDSLKGICSILFALKLLKSDMDAIGTLWIVKIDQMSAFLLRFSNLATILNLTMITINEYLFICYPLQYPNIVTRNRVICCLVVSWITSFGLTISNAVVSQAHQSILIDLECQAEFEAQDDSLNETETFPCLLHVEPSRSAQYAYHFGVIVFCGICLAITATSYIILLRVISRIVKADFSSTAEAVYLNENMQNGDRRVLEKSLVKRHKYVAVIGTVIIVYAVYLTAYASIQLLQLINMTSGLSSHYVFVYVKYVCYTFISLHSILQPVCYLRMREFRCLVKRAICTSKRKQSEIIYQDQCGSDGRRSDLIDSRRATNKEFL